MTNPTSSANYLIFSNLQLLLAAIYSSIWTLIYFIQRDPFAGPSGVFKKVRGREQPVGLAMLEPPLQGLNPSLCLA